MYPIKIIINSLKKLIRYPIYSLNVLWRGVRTNRDDFNWDSYTLHYKKELRITESDI